MHGCMVHLTMQAETVHLGNLQELRELQAITTPEHIKSQRLGQTVLSHR